MHADLVLWYLPDIISLSNDLLYPYNACGVFFVCFALDSVCSDINIATATFF